MSANDFWTSHYVTVTDPDEVARASRRLRFTAGPDSLELVTFAQNRADPNILISQGSGGPPHIFAELAYHLHLAGYNVFIMPKQGGYTVDQLMDRHRGALRYIAREFNDTIGVYSEGLGGYIAFYLALAHAPIRSLVCENSPAIMTEQAYHDALLIDGGPWTRTVRRRRLMLPFLRPLSRALPGLKVPISSYLSWTDLIDPRDDANAIERHLVRDGYLKDPDFDHWYPLSAVMSLMTTPPPAPLDQLTTPTMFVVASDGPTPQYIVDLYHRLPAVPKKLVRVDGSVYWMLSHVREAATLVADWFATTLTPSGAATTGGLANDVAP